MTRRTIADNTPSLVAMLVIGVLLFGGAGIACLWFAGFGEFAGRGGNVVALRAIMMGLFLASTVGLAFERRRRAAGGT